MSAVPPSSVESDAFEPDPVYLNSRREGLVILCIWFAALMWAVPCCYLTGFGEGIYADGVKTIWGMPHWVFLGIFLPWLVADVATTIFCFWFMQDDDLGEAHEGADLEEEVAAMTHPQAGGDQ